MKFNKKEQAGQELSKQEQIRAQRIYELRDKAFYKMRDTIAKYYDVAIGGDIFSYAGMPEIERGIKG
jgi:hypothetical protein